MTHRIGRIKVWVQDLVDVFGSPAMGDAAGKGGPYHDIEWDISNAGLGALRLYTYKNKEYAHNQEVCDIHVGGWDECQLDQLVDFLDSVGVEVFATGP